MAFAFGAWTRANHESAPRRAEELTAENAGKKKKKKKKKKKRAHRRGRRGRREEGNHHGGTGGTEQRRRNHRRGRREETRMSRFRPRLCLRLCLCSCLCLCLCPCLRLPPPLLAASALGRPGNRLGLRFRRRLGDRLDGRHGLLVVLF